MSGNKTIYSDVRRINLKVLNTVFEEPVSLHDDATPRLQGSNLADAPGWHGGCERG